MAHIYLNPTTAKQVQLEATMLDLGKQKFLSRLEKERKRGQVAGAGGVAKLLDNVYTVVAEELVKWMKTFEDTGVGKRPKAYALLKNVAPELVAYVGLRVTLDQIMSRGGCYEYKAAQSIGAWLEHELRLQDFEKKNKRYLDRTLAIYRKRTRNAEHVRSAIIHAMNKKGHDWKDWSHGEQVACGMAVLDCIYNAQVMFERDNSDISGRIKITLLPQALDWIGQVTEPLMELSPLILPCIEPPLPWSTPYDGGYHTKQLRDNHPLLTAFHKKERLKLLEKANMPKVYRAVNALQATPWRINDKVLSVMKTLRDQHMDLGVLPEIKELELPPRPANIDTDPEILKAWKRDASNVYNERVRQQSKRLNLHRTVDVASEYSGRDMYFVYACDFRGRLYAQGSGPNPQGTDYQKALLLFAKGKPIGEAGIPWLFIHTANSWGVDKVSLQERIDWTYDNLDMITKVAADPMANPIWTQADSPWLFLAACFELAGVVEQGAEYVTHLPIMVDGSCNGLQHYSAMLRDPIGGEATNLVPMGQPQDIYGRVANVVVAKDPILKGIVTRSVTKRPVMVLPYGGTVASCKDYVRAALKDAGHTFEPERETEIALLVWESIGDVVVAARDGMAYLRQLTSVMSKKKLHMSWVTPTGWPVLQQYFNMKRNQTQIKYLNKRVAHVSYSPQMDTVDGRRSSQGMPPNFVHSLDAAALVLMVDMALDNGIENFAVVHDSFGTLAPDMDMLNGCIRTSFVNMYREHDVLEELRERVAKAVGPRIAKGLPPVPEKGSLDLEGVLESPFFFA